MGSTVNMPLVGIEFNIREIWRNASQLGGIYIQSIWLNKMIKKDHFSALNWNLRIKMVCVMLLCSTLDINYIVPVSKGKQVRNCSVIHITNYSDTATHTISRLKRRLFQIVPRVHHVQQAKQCTFFHPYSILHILCINLRF